MIKFLIDLETYEIISQLAWFVYNYACTKIVRSRPKLMRYMD